MQKIISGPISHRAFGNPQFLKQPVLNPPRTSASCRARFPRVEPCAPHPAQPVPPRPEIRRPRSGRPTSGGAGRKVRSPSAPGPTPAQPAGTLASPPSPAAPTVPATLRPTILLLWDIDGTLITSGGAGARALRAALHRSFAIDGSLDDLDFAGRTDRWILRKILQKFALPTTEENFRVLLDAYLAALPRELAHPSALVLPGIRALLAATAGPSDFAQGILTGNVRRGAQTKLAHHSLWDHFAFGAFGDDSELRNELGPHALRRARAHTGADFALDRVWIIGDTAHDIACARAFGARVLAVATGGHALTALAAHRPDALLPDLADTAAVLRVFTP